MEPSVARSRLLDAGLALASGLIATALAAGAMGLSLSALAVPWNEGDLLPVYSYAENMSRGNWFLRNPDLGLPAFQDHGHFPVTDLTSILQIGVLSQLTSNPITAVNLFILGTFFSVAAAAHVVSRYLGVNRYAALVLSVSFSVLPWHFTRAGGHAFLASYMSVPLTFFLLDVVARRRLERPHPWWFLLSAVGIGLVVGTNGIYYALLATILLGTALLADSVRTGLRLPHWRALLVSASVPLGAALAIALNRWSISTPSTAETVVRQPGESVLYGGTLSTLLFPASSTASGRALSGWLDLTFPRILEGDALLSSAAVIAVIVTILLVGLRWTTERALEPGSALKNASYWPGVFLFVCAFFVANGLGALFSFWVSSDIRAWGRYAIFASGAAFVVTGLALTAWSASRRAIPRFSSLGLTTLIGLLAILDLTGGGLRPNLGPFISRDDELRSYVADLENRLEDKCPVLQWPLIGFPEMPAVNGMLDYSHLWTYIYSDDLRWSYGAVKGTPPGEWGQDDQGDSTALRALAAQAGFCGIQVDAAALGTPAEGLPLLEGLGEPDLVSSSGRWAYFDLTGQLAGEFVYQPTKGFAPPETSLEHAVSWWMTSRRGKVEVTGRPGEQLTIGLELFSPPCGPVSALVDGREIRIEGTATTRLPVALDEEGTATVDLISTSEPCEVDGDDRPLYLGLAGQHLGS